MLYDKYHKKRITQQWCDAVAHVADQRLPEYSMPRRITILMSAPPGDGLRPPRELFYEYVKPILVAGALDWEVVEGRREGDVRFAVAERIRSRRRKADGLAVEQPEATGPAAQKSALERQRASAGTYEYNIGPQGDLILGRTTWKEYVRGLHEGWLGPLQAPAEIIAEDKISEDAAKVNSSMNPKKEADGHAHSTIGDAAVKAAAEVALTSVDVASTAAETTETDKTEKSEAEAQDEKPKPKFKPAPYITTAAYSTAQLPECLPQTFEPVSVLPFPHILGFLNTPIRLYRFLNRRQLADDIGRQTAAMVLAAQTRPLSLDAVGTNHDSTSEQQAILIHEEADWPKKIRQRKADGVEAEDVLLDPIVLDARIAERMNTFVEGRDENSGTSG